MPSPTEIGGGGSEHAASDEQDQGEQARQRGGASCDYDIPMSPRIGRAPSPAEWTGLSTAGALFLVWLVARFPLHPGHQLPPRPAHVGSRRRLSLHAPVDLPGGAAPRQPGHRVHQRAGRSTRRCSTAIRSATRSINMECYIFQPGKVADQFIEALSERARLGVNVTIVVDAIGSFNLWGRPLRRLREAGLPDRVVPAVRVAPARALEQPDPPRAARHRRQGGVHRRRRHRRLVGLPATSKQPAMARHDGADRRADRRRAAGGRRRELARVLRRDHDRARLLSAASSRPATRPRS